MNIEKMLQRAINKNELKEFLKGKGNYNIPNREGITNDNLRALKEGIYRYYENHPNSGIERLFEQALLQMMNGSEEDILIAFDYLRMQVVSEVKKTAPFYFDKNVYVAMKTAVELNKEKLERYNSTDYTGHPYQYIENMDNYMQEQYGRRVL